MIQQILQAAAANGITGTAEPVGPSDFLHDWTLIPPSEAAAAPRSNGALDPPLLSVAFGASAGLPAAAASAPLKSFGASFGGSGTAAGAGVAGVAAA